jgi:4-amino-4-deoxy-L-arabinose transferase-like glycosyltransferase
MISKFELGLYALIMGLVAIFHFASGSSRAELGSHPDEAAHYVTGLMVRDYLASGFHESPLRYADEYYRHYPKIGLGNWPPFFYLVQAGWTLLFGSTVDSVLRLMALLEIALALRTARWLWREFGWIEAAAGAVLLTALPLTQQYSNMVMAEVLSALTMFGAAGFFALYLEGEEWRGAVGFGICAGLAIMTKGTGLALAFVPPLAILFTGRYALLKRRSLWVAALLVAVIAGPWTWHFRNEGRGGWQEASPSLHFTKEAIGYYLWRLCVALGGLLAAPALAGAGSLFLPRTRKPAIAVCSLALVAGVWIFQCLMPVGLEARHLMPAIPALIVLAMTGLRTITVRWPRARPALAAGLLAVFFGWPAIFPPAATGYGSIGNELAVSPFRIPRKQWGGFESVADRALAAGPARPILVASDARGEGMFIAEMAARDPHRPSYTVQRASKILASSTWSGSGYQSLYQTQEQVRDALEKGGIGLVVTDSSLAPQPPHDKLLIETVTADPTSFGVLRTSTALRDGRATPGAIQLRTVPWPLK